MARVELAPGILDDFDRFLEHWEHYGVQDARARITAIIQAFDILTHSPLIGRPVAGGRRALVIGRGARRTVALYRFVPRIDTVLILAIRYHREHGLARDG